jgi:hypothetical protein
MVTSRFRWTLVLSARFGLNHCDSSWIGPQLACPFAFWIQAVLLELAQPFPLHALHH